VTTKFALLSGRRERGGCFGRGASCSRSGELRRPTATTARRSGGDGVGARGDDLEKRIEALAVGVDTLRHQCCMLLPQIGVLAAQLRYLRFGFGKERKKGKKRSSKCAGTSASVPTCQPPPCRSWRDQSPAAKLQGRIFPSPRANGIEQVALSRDQRPINVPEEKS